MDSERMETVGKTGQRGDFGPELRRWRGVRGLSLAGLSRLVHYSKGYLSKIENGEKPATADVARRCDEALAADGRLTALVPPPGTCAPRSGVAIPAQVSPVDPPVAEADRCPYPGMAPFESADAQWFFGRERATALLVQRLTEGLTSPGPITVVAPSGAGKSSLLRAGLVPALRRGVLPTAGTPDTVFTPTCDPVGELAARAAAVTGADQADLAVAVRTDLARFVRIVCECRPVLIVDQFEETFTLCDDETERALFVTALCALGEHAALVILGVRADFYGRLLAYPALVPFLQDRHVALGPMCIEEVRAAVTRPARLAGLSIEPGLVELLLHDLGATPGPLGTYEPGALPLLAHALLSTWQNRENQVLTTAGYQLTGGIHGAVAATAERVHAGLDQEGRAIARQLLLRLVHVDEDNGQARRRATVEQLHRQIPGAALDDVLAAFVRARLLTADRGTVEITHEALLTAWPRLRDWIEADRAGLRVHQQLSAAAEEWEQAGREDSLLYRGVRLAVAHEWAAEHRADACTGENAFLTASADLAAAEHASRQRGVRRLRRLVTALAVALVLSLVAVVVAVDKTRTARAERNTAASRELAGKAHDVMAVDPAGAMLLAVEAYRRSPTPEATSALLSMQSTQFAGRLIGHTGPLYGLAFSPDGSRLATSSYDRTVRLWDTATRRQAGDSLAVHNGPVHGVAWAGDGRMLATVADGLVRLWEPTTGRRVRDLAGYENPFQAVAFHPAGDLLAASGRHNTIRLWDVRNARHLPDLTGHTDTVEGLAFHPDGHLMASAGADATVRLWDIATHIQVAVLPGHDGTVWDVAWSPDGALLATAGEDQTTRLWTPTVPTEVLRGHRNAVHAVAFSPRGQLATASSDNTVALWNLSGRVLANTSTGALTGLAVRPHHRTVAIAGDDSTTQLWDLATGTRITTLRGHTAPVSSVNYSPSGEELLTTSHDTTARLWDADTHRPRQVLAGHTAAVTSSAFSADGTLVVTGSDDHTVRLWDTRTGALVRVLGRHDGPVYAVVLAATNPDTWASAGYDNVVRLWTAAATGDTMATTGTVRALTTDTARTWLAAGSEDHDVRIWPTDTWSPVTRLANRDGATTALAAAPRGDTLAVGSVDGTIRLWDLTDRQETAALSGHTTTVRAVGFVEDRRLLSVGEDGRLRVWDLDPTAVIQHLCRTVGPTPEKVWQATEPAIQYPGTCS